MQAIFIAKKIHKKHPISQDYISQKHRKEIIVSEAKKYIDYIDYYSDLLQLPTRKTWFTIFMMVNLVLSVHRYNLRVSRKAANY